MYMKLRNICIASLLGLASLTCYADLGFDTDEQRSLLVFKPEKEVNMKLIDHQFLTNDQFYTDEKHNFEYCFTQQEINNLRKFVPNVDPCVKRQLQYPKYMNENEDLSFISHVIMPFLYFKEFKLPYSDEYENVLKEIARAPQLYKELLPSALHSSVLKLSFYKDLNTLIKEEQYFEGSNKTCNLDLMTIVNLNFISSSNNNSGLKYFEELVPDIQVFDKGKTYQFVKGNFFTLTYDGIVFALTPVVNGKNVGSKSCDYILTSKSYNSLAVEFPAFSDSYYQLEALMNNPEMLQQYYLNGGFFVDHRTLGE